MPELPEVETLRRELVSAVKSKTVKTVKVDWPKMVRPLTPLEFGKRLKGKKITAVNRRAKVLLLELNDGNYLIIHLKLTGQLIYIDKRQVTRDKLVVAPRPFNNFKVVSSKAERRQARGKKKPRLVFGGHPQKGGLDNLPNKFTHIIINFTDGSILYFNDLRKFGWMKIVSRKQVDTLVSEYGVEPLTKGFNLEKLKEILKRYSKRKVKQILMDQSLISGLGNIYCDESCFCAKILPTRIIKTLKENEIKNLYYCIPKILKLALFKKGTSANTYVQLDGQPGGMVPYLKVYGRQGERCKRCRGIISKIKLNGRGTHFCPKCQK